MAIEPITREEMLFSAIADGSGSDMKPITREEMFLHAIANGSETELEPITRKEMFLDKILKNGVGGGGSGSGSCDDVRYVTFMSYDGTVEHGKKAVAVGDDCADPIARGIFETPTKESTQQYIYTFYGWANTPNGAADPNWNKAITEDKTVYANFVSVKLCTITYYDDDGITVLKKEVLHYGSMPSYTPTKDGFEFGGWNPELTIATGDASYTAKWNDMSPWGAVLASIADGSYKTKYAIGDTVPLDLGSEGKINMEIVAFDTDILADGSGKAPITWIAVELLKTSHRMNPSREKYTEGTGSIGGWEKCEMRTYLKETIKPLMPGKVRNAIKTVTKTQRAYDTSESKFIQTTADDVWITDGSEVVGAFSGDIKYAHYCENESKLIKHKIGETSNSAWWFRAAGNVSKFDEVRTGGGWGYSNDAEEEQGVLLCFCT